MRTIRVTKNFLATIQFYCKEFALYNFIATVFTLHIFTSIHFPHYFIRILLNLQCENLSDKIHNENFLRKNCIVRKVPKKSLPHEWYTHLLLCDKLRSTRNFCHINDAYLLLQKNLSCKKSSLPHKWNSFVTLFCFSVRKHLCHVFATEFVPEHVYATDLPLILLLLL